MQRCRRSGLMYNIKSITSLPYKYPRQPRYTPPFSYNMEFIQKGVSSILQNSNPLTLLPLFLFCLFLYKCLIQHNSGATNLPPSPRGLPVIGNLHQLTSKPHHGLFELSRQYGDTMLLHLGAKPVLVVSSASSAHHVMKTHDVAFANRPQWGIFWRILYDGRDVAAACYGEYWRQIRSVSVLQLLSNSRVRSYSKVRREEVSLMLEKIGGLVNKEVNLSEIFMEATNDVVCRVAFGRKYGKKSEFKRLLGEFLELLGGFYVGDFIPRLSWVNRFSGLNGRVDRFIAELDGLLEGVVKEHEDRVVNMGKDEDGSAKDFVDVLLEAQRDKATGFDLERDSIKAIILDAFAAGTDTTYTVLEWAMSELLRHPEALKTLQSEVRETITTSSSPTITDEGLDKMKYLKATIKETLRLHPPIPLLVPRESTQEVELNGYTIPAGTQVITNAWAIQRDPAHWASPNEFRPDRFLDSSIDFKGRDFELIPFGAGRRGCPGIHFAIASIELVLASLVWKFDWSLPNGVEAKSLDMEETNALTVHRKNSLIVVPSLPKII